MHHHLKFRLVAWALAVFGTGALFAQGSPRHRSTAPSGAGRSPVETASEASVSGNPLSSWMVVPQMSILSPWSFVLQTPIYRIPYSNNFEGLPLLSVGGSKAIVEMGSLRFFAEGRVGFAFKSGIVGYRNDVNGVEHRDNLSLLAVPLSGAIRGMYRIPKVTFLTPTLALGGGLQWIHQAGGAPELAESFLVPFYLISPGLTFLEGRNPTDWFGGFYFSMTFMNSFASVQTVRGVSFDLGVNILL